MLSMIFVFVFDMGSYLYRAMSLNQRMENIMVSMQRIVSENNGLTPDAYSMYKSMFIQLAKDMNAGEPGSFINGYWINYGDDAASQHLALSSLTATRNGTSVDVLIQDMAELGQYGDVMVVQVGVSIDQPTWGFTGSSHSAANWNNDRTSSVLKPRQHEMWYTYYVPCLGYPAN
jgi:hypothetical protein